MPLNMLFANSRDDNPTRLLQDNVLFFFGSMILVEATCDEALYAHPLCPPVRSTEEIIGIRPPERDRGGASSGKNAERGGCSGVRE